MLAFRSRQPSVVQAAPGRQQKARSVSGNGCRDAQRTPSAGFSRACIFGQDFSPDFKRAVRFRAFPSGSRAKFVVPVVNGRERGRSPAAATCRYPTYLIPAVLLSLLVLWLSPRCRYGPMTPQRPVGWPRPPTSAPWRSPHRTARCLPSAIWPSPGRRPGSAWWGRP